LPPSFGRELEKKVGTLTLFDFLSFQYDSLVNHYLGMQKEDERPKEKEKGKPRAIDTVMEELRLEKELREKRNQERGSRGDASVVGISYVCSVLSTGHNMKEIRW
jgi:hypothetical protein